MSGCVEEISNMQQMKNWKYKGSKYIQMKRGTIQREDADEDVRLEISAAE